MNTVLQLVETPKRNKRPSKTEMVAVLESSNTALNEHVADLTAKLYALENPLQSEVVEAVKVAFNRRNRLAALWGLVKGGWAPLASYFVAHAEINGDYAGHPILTGLVIGALLFSAPTVYEWCKAAFHSSIKAVGFVILLEGVMVFSSLHWLGVSALALLVAINGIQSACNLAIRKKEPEFSF